MDAPSPFDDYPAKPTRGWMIEALTALGEDHVGDNEQLAQRLRRFGFEIETPLPTWPPKETAPPKRPTTGWLHHTLRARGIDKDMPGEHGSAKWRAEALRRLNAQGMNLGDDVDDDGAAGGGDR